MSGFKRVLQTIAVSVAFLLVLALVLYIASSSSYFAELEPIYVFVALVPFVVLLITSGRLKEIRGPGGIALSMRDEAQKPISPELSKTKLEVDPDITMDKGRLDLLQERIAQNPPTALSFQVGKKGYYRESAIWEYIQELEGYPGFRNILLIDGDGKFKGFMRVEDFKVLMRGDDIVAQLESGRIQQYPRVVTASIPLGATNQQALSEMERLDTNVLAVVDRHEKFVGVITQEEIVRKILSKALREA